MIQSHGVKARSALWILLRYIEVVTADIVSTEDGNTQVRIVRRIQVIHPRDLLTVNINTAK